MSRAAMSLTAATSGFFVFLLSVQVIQGGSDWGVTYSPSPICALKGSTVEIHCRYTYPSRVNTTVERTLWFTKWQDKEPVDLRADSEYAGRVQYHCVNNYCTLRITDLRESDSAEYKFRFTTKQPVGKYAGSPGVTLSVTGFQVQTNIVRSCNIESCKYATLSCHSSCHLRHRPSYIWYKNGKKIKEQQEPYKHYFYPEDSYSCALKGHEDVHSPLLCVHGQSCNRVTYTSRSICAFKGSSVDISCTYNSFKSITSKLWFSSKLSDQQGYNTQHKEVSKDPQYDRRVDVKAWGERSTLRITDLRKSDSAQYRFKFKAGSFEWESSLPGTTLTVTDADLQVQVIWSPAGPKLICHSSCLPSGSSSFIWYKNQTEIQGETSVSYGGYVDLADSYSCAYQSYHSPPVFVPKVPTLLKSSSDDIMKGDSVTLTCSSDANPAAKYTWYKKSQTPLSEGPQLVFSSIQSSDSGEYYCTAENELGRRTSEYVFISVQYAPKLPSVSVSPSAEIVEGSSVTLTCSSDANPAAKYTWYKENQTLFEGQEDIFFTSISSEDRGSYHCKSENRHGQINSSSLLLDVQYAPKLPSVSVSPSAEIVEGDSVNLTCSSDANPAANYTWYKENEDSPKASGQIFTITDFRAERSGNYYCEAQNTRGRQISTLHLTVVAGAWKLAAAGTISCVLLAILAVLTVFLWIRRKKALTQQLHGGERPDNGPQLNMGPVYDVPSAAAQRQPAEQQDELHYSSISFPQNQEEALYSNVRPAQPHRQREEEDEDSGVEYTAIKTESASGAPGTRRQEDGEDLCALYSTVKK